MTFDRVLGILGLLAVVAWFAALACGGIAASNAFTVLPQNPIVLPDYSAVPEHEHGRLAAGIVMNRIFFTNDVIQFFAVPLAVVVHLIIAFRAKRLSRTLAAAALVIAGGLFAYYALGVAPPLNHELRAYWADAQAGDLEAAAAHHATFDGYHKTAEAILRANTLFLFGAIVCIGAAVERPRGLEKPRLAT